MVLNLTICSDKILTKSILFIPMFNMSGDISKEIRDTQKSNKNNNKDATNKIAISIKSYCSKLKEFLFGLIPDS